MKMYSPLKKTSSVPCMPSPYVFNKVSSFEVKPDIPYFPTILATPSVESFTETPALKTKSFLEKIELR